ncbi:hypothetical protein J1C05_001820 [Escherichia fergusonii]|nr:hypothetical protein [Escherichia fergusonii]EHJ4134287.1 hypothetical protein [Escherichia fergusonii]
MSINPFDVKINEKFCEINKSDSKSNLLKEIRDKVYLVQPYDNYALTFYHNTLYYFTANSKRYIVFGHDLEGHYAIEEKSRRIYHISNGKNDQCSYSLIFCNTNINHFISFNNIFIFMVLEQAKILNYENQCDSDDEKIFDILDNYFTECDPLSMAEDMFWHVRSYMLRDGFFPTNDTQINFYKDMMLKSNMTNE